MSRPLVDIRLNSRLLRTAINALVRRKGPEVVDRVIRKTAFDVVSYTVRALNGAEAGYPHPKRIDTGRYRAAWVVAGESAIGRRAGSASVSAVSSHTGKANPPQPGDGSARWQGRGLTQLVTVSNAVEYGPEVEFGTRHMAAGLHLSRALAVSAKGVLEAAGIELSRAWGV